MRLIPSKDKRRKIKLDDMMKDIVENLINIFNVFLYNIYTYSSMPQSNKFPSLKRTLKVPINVSNIRNEFNSWYRVSSKIRNN